MNSSALDLSVVIITLNEATNIRRCLTSLPNHCEIIIVDSGSTDDTIPIAKEFQAKIFHRSFDDYASQKNFGIEQASKSWILSVDADEEISPNLANQIVATISKSSNKLVAFRIRRSLIFMSRQMQWGKTNDFPIRLFKSGQGRFFGTIHEEIRLTPETRLVKITGGKIFHFSYKNLTDYFNKFNIYTSQMAKSKETKSKQSPNIFFFCLRPLWEFFTRYFLRLGFLDGYPGYCYALISSLYVFIKYAKLHEQIEQSTTKHA